VTTNEGGYGGISILSASMGKQRRGKASAVAVGAIVMLVE